MSISIASEMVIKVLKEKMPPLIRPEQIGLCTPSENGDKFLLGAFVYSITRDMKAHTNGNIRVDASTSVKPPLCVELCIAITSYAGKKSGVLDDYKILERVMQIWHDGSALPMTSPLQPSHVAAPKMELLTISQDEISKIWQFSDIPLMLSLFYKIAPIAIPSQTQITTAPIGSVDYSGGGL